MTKIPNYKKNIYEESNNISLWLDGKVRFESDDNYYTTIWCVNCYPFYDYQISDYVEVDNDETEYYSSGHDFNDISIIRKVATTNVITTRGSSSDIVVSPSAVNYMKSQEARELAREMSQMVDDTGKEVEYKIQVENKDGKKISHSLILRKK